MQTLFAQQIFTKIAPFSYTGGNGLPPTFFTPYGTFQQFDSTYTIMGCVYEGTHTSHYYNYIVHLNANGSYDSSKYISPSTIGGIYTCATFLLTDSLLTLPFTPERWKHDTVRFGNITWTLKENKDNFGITYIQLVKDDGNSTYLLDTIGQSFYTFSQYLIYAASPLIAPLADGALLIVYTNSDQMLQFVKYNTVSNMVDYRFTVTNDLLSLFGNPLKYANASGHISMLKTLDGGYLLTSKINRLEFDWQNNMMLIKFDSVGNFYWPFATGQKEIPDLLHSVYPNPVTDELYFELHEPGQYTLTVTDVNGQVVYQTVVKDKTKIETALWSSGVYFYQLTSGSNTNTGKFVKM
ncbi:MAG: T9SS type A sorting domain-containing protein [Bacteroidia bacterium]|nr:T9SS type A sorting domain-containing protein [Bacteroidia bacterium]